MSILYMLKEMMLIEDQHINLKLVYYEQKKKR